MLVLDRLSAEKLSAALGPSTIGREIIILEETTSTNDVVLKMAQGGAREGTKASATASKAHPGRSPHPRDRKSGKGKPGEGKSRKPKKGKSWKR